MCAVTAWGPDGNEYPDRGASAEVYTNPDPKEYVELEMLGPLARLLANRFRVISYQLRGEDDCFVLRQPFGFDDLVTDLSEFVDWYGLETPAVMGVSTGPGLIVTTRTPNRPMRLRMASR